MAYTLKVGGGGVGLFTLRLAREKLTPYGGPKKSNQIYLIYLNIKYSSVFGIADYRSSFRLKKILNGECNMAVM